MSKDTKNKRTKAQRENDLLFISDLYVKNYSYRAIADKLNEVRPYSITFQQVSYDVKKLLEQWQAEHNEKIDAYKIEQLKKLDQLESEYWQAWERSKEEFRKKTIKGKKTGGKATPTEQTLHTEERNGNPAYLAGVERCIERRAKLLGLTVDKVEHSGEVGFKFNYIAPKTEDAGD
jgi:hypothetical protein